MKITSLSKTRTKFFVLIFSLVIAISLSSCMTTKTSVGTYREKVGTEYLYAKGKQVWLFWGIVPVGRTNVNTPSDGNCEVVTTRTLPDILIGTLTAGIVSTYTIKVKAKK